jgi:hypothetical protein
MQNDKKQAFFLFLRGKRGFFYEKCGLDDEKSIKNFSEYRKNINFAKYTEKLTLWRKYSLITVTA